MLTSLTMTESSTPDEPKENVSSFNQTSVLSTAEFSAVGSKIGLCSKVDIISSHARSFARIVSNSLIALTHICCRDVAWFFDIGRTSVAAYSEAISGCW